jgi:COMPASS component SWD1
MDASGQTFPEAIEDFLEDGIAVTSAFNRRGTMLAVGCNDGR